MRPGRERPDARVLFSPSSVAIVGASSNPAGHAGRALTNLDRTDYPGRIHPINPKYDELLGYRCYPDVASIPEAPEVVYVLLPAESAVRAVADAGAAGVRVAVVCSSGFSELGETGRDLQARLGEIADEYGIRIIGPNCIGIVSPAGHFVGAPTFNITYDQRPGGVAVLSHSGGLGVTVFNRAQAVGTGIHSMTSLGNEADLTMGEVLDVLAHEDEVHTIALVVEEIRDPDQFREAVRAAVGAGKSVIALKNGRSEAGMTAVAGHTGALAGDHKVFSTVLRDLGVIEVSTVDAMVDTLHLLDRTVGQSLGARVGVVSPSGGETVYVADRSGEFGITLPALTPELTERIQGWMPLGNPANPLDLTGQIIGDADLLSKVLEAVGSQADIDVVMVCLATWGEFDANAILSRVVEAARGVPTPVLFTAWDAGRMTERVEQVLDESGLPWFSSPDRGLAALSLVAGRPEPVRASPVSAGDETVADAPTGRTSLGEVDAAQVLSDLGVSMVESAVVTGAEDAVAVADKWDHEVVLKLNAPDVLHKSELGLVEVDVASADDVRVVVDRFFTIAREHDLSHNGILVARKERGTEVIVGGVRDASFGPFVLLGAGGILAEYLADTVLVSAPASPEQVRSALSRLSSSEILSGVRGRTNDMDALVELVATFSRAFVSNPWMAEVDMNPVIVRSTEDGGAVAVDAVIVVTTNSAAEGEVSQ